MSSEPIRTGRADAPWWFRLACGTSLGLLLLVVFVVTFLAWAWRTTHPSWLLPTLLFAEMGTAVFALTRGRRRLQRAWAGLYALVRAGRLRWGILALGLAFATCVVRPFWPDASAPAGDPKTRRVAIVGGGAAGLHAGWMLHHAGIEFDLYEAAEYFGGHAYTPEFVDATGKAHPLDVGFIFGSAQSYEELKILMRVFGIGRVESELSYSSCADGVEWWTDSGQPVDPEVERFHALAERLSEDKSLELIPAGVWLWWNGFDEDFRRQYLGPILSIIFVTTDVYEHSTREVLALHAGSRKWLDMRHGHPAWAVAGGSRGYYLRLTEPFVDRIQLLTPVTRIERIDGRVKLTAVDNANQVIEEWYDDVILAVSAEVAHELVQDKNWLESWLLDEVRYQDAVIALHTDESVLPAEHMQRSYNFMQIDGWGEGWQLSGIMDEVMDIPGGIEPRAIGTLNPQGPLNDVRARRGWRHHNPDLWHLALMFELLPTIQGDGHIWYAGDWIRWLGHGPAIQAGMRAACEVGADQPLPVDEDAECVDAVIRDAMDWVDVEERRVTVCGQVGAFNYFVEKTCKRRLR